MVKKQLIDALGVTRENKMVDASALLSSGSTLLNLACTNDWRGGFQKGDYIWWVGDSNSGKTFFALTTLAEAAANKNFKGYRFLYDDVENGALMDLERFYGKKMAKRMEAPGGYDDEGNPIYSETIEDFYYNLDDAFKEGRPFIYVLDSMDALDSNASEKLFEHNKKVARGEARKRSGEDQDEKQSYGDGKAKFNSQHIRRYASRLKKNGSILIINTQTRDSLARFGDPKTAAGGRALKFYAHINIWTSIAGDITATVEGKKRSLGTMSRLHVKKNRRAGQRLAVDVPIYTSYGVDDLGSCIDYLVDEGVWSKKKESIVADCFGVTKSRAKLIDYIEEQCLEDDVRVLVGKRWNQIIDASALKRKPRFE